MTEIILKDHLPPSDELLEQSVLGAILIDKDCINIVSPLIFDVNIFYYEKHQLIYNACKELNDNGNPIDLRTVTALMRKNKTLEKIGGALFITSLTNHIQSIANTHFHVAVLREYYMKRMVYDISYKNMVLARKDETDCFDLLDRTMMQLYKMIEKLQSKSIETGLSIFDKAIQQIEIAMNTKGIVGIPTGLKKIDIFTGGWQKQDLIIIAARPAMGKTAFVLQVAKNAVFEGKKVLIFSLEMSYIQLMLRLISSETGIKGSDLTRGKISTNELATILKKTPKLRDFNLKIDDTASLSISALKSKATLTKVQSGLDLIVIDYLQLITTDNSKGFREQEISYISRSLKALAKELDIPIIALSQCSRKCEDRTDKRPNLSDLRESGAIEQDADSVIFLYRDYYYGNEINPETNESTENVLEVIWAKHRNGSVGTVELFCSLGINAIADEKPTFAKFYNPLLEIKPNIEDVKW